MQLVGQEEGPQVGSGTSRRRQTADAPRPAALRTAVEANGTTPPTIACSCGSLASLAESEASDAGKEPGPCGGMDQHGSF